MAAREFVRAGRLTWLGWLYLTLSAIGLGVAAYFIASGSLLFGILCLVGAFGDAYFVYTGWNNNKA